MHRVVAMILGVVLWGHHARVEAEPSECAKPVCTEAQQVSGWFTEKDGEEVALQQGLQQTRSSRENEVAG